MRNTRVVLLASLSLSLPFSMLSTSLAAQELTLLTASNQLMRVDAGLAGLVLGSRPITGLAANESLHGIDYRPQNGQLFSISNRSQLYRIDPATGAATAVGPQLTTLLSGTSFGFDFNPTVDRIRVTSNTGQNLRLHPDTGAVAAVDGTLAYAATDPNFGQVPSIIASGYTNNFAGATTTTLYDIDTNLDVLVMQNPPNNGTLNTVGPLGVNSGRLAGFDISGTTGVAYALLTSPGAGVSTSSLFTINLQTGAASFLSTIGTPEVVMGMAVLPTPGAVQYGNATPGCAGVGTISANSSPTVGNASFAIFGANAPINSVGRMMLGSQGLTSPQVFLGLALWVDQSSAFLLWLPAMSDAVGTTQMNVPIPSDAGLAGAKLFAQFAFVEPCARIGLSTSNALAITVQSGGGR